MIHSLRNMTSSKYSRRKISLPDNDLLINNIAAEGAHTPNSASQPASIGMDSPKVTSSVVKRRKVSGNSTVSTTSNVSAAAAAAGFAVEGAEILCGGSHL